MALPKLATAKYELTLPSTGQKVEFRPFLVKEEKMLMLAQQEGSQQSLIRAVQDLIDACTFGKLDSKKLPLKTRLIYGQIKDTLNDFCKNREFFIKF